LKLDLSGGAFKKSRSDGILFERNTQQLVVCAVMNLQGGQVETAVNKFGDKEIRWSSQGMIRLSLEAMKRLFEPTVERIKQAIQDVLSNVSGWFKL